MLSRYKGERYRAKASPDLVAFVDSDELHAYDYDSAIGFYDQVLRVAGNGDLAFLGAVDRFFLLTNLLGRFDALHPWLYDRCREVELEPDGHLDLWSRFHYKAQCLETPTLTPTGWRRFGDLGVGDHVFGPDGKPTRIIARTPVFWDADCYRVTFDKGESIVCSGDHLWTVDVSHKARLPGGKRSKRATVTMDTRSLMKKVDHAIFTKTCVLPSVPLAEPLVFDPLTEPLPLHPYVMGAWLGDGSRGSAVIANDPRDNEIVERIEACGFRTRRRRAVMAVGIYGLAAPLRAAGVWLNKHIPEVYQRATVDERWELLRGLMDTDGHCDTRGTATFCNANEGLANDVFDLAAGLGLKPSLRRPVGEYQGQPYPYFQVSFQVRAGGPAVFSLARKQANAAIGKGTRSTRHAIVSVEPVDTVPVRCIQVERSDGLYLTGRQHVTTHNSSVITFAGSIQEILNDPTVTIGIFFHTKGIAAKFVAQIKREFEKNHDIRTLYPDICWLKPRSEAPIWSESAFTVRRAGNPKEATVEGHGVVDGQPTSRHFQLLIYDDMVTRESVTTPEQVKKTTESFELSTNLGTAKGRRWMIGTRYSFADSYGEIITRGVAKPRIYPATHNGKLEGRPVLLSQSEWDTKKKEQASQVAAQMLQNPLGGKERVFRPEWFKPWFVRPAAMNVYIMGDPSRGRSAKSDNTAIAVIGIDGRSNKYLLDGARRRMTLSQRWDHLKHFHKKWSAVPGVNFVKVGYERYGQQSDDEYFVERMNVERYVFSIEELAWPNEGGGSKRDRVERLQPDVQYGSFYFPGLVHVGGLGTCLWDANMEDDGTKAGASGQMNFRALKGELSAQADAIARGQDYLVAKPLTRKNEEGELYDLTRQLMDEMLYFPFGTKDDFVDATSRIYDMEPVAASTNDEVPELPETVD